MEHIDVLLFAVDDTNTLENLSRRLVVLATEIPAGMEISQRRVSVAARAELVAVLNAGTPTTPSCSRAVRACAHILCAVRQHKGLSDSNFGHVSVTHFCNGFAIVQL